MTSPQRHIPQFCGERYSSWLLERPSNPNIKCSDGSTDGPSAISLTNTSFVYLDCFRISSLSCWIDAVSSYQYLLPLSSLSWHETSSHPGLYGALILGQHRRLGRCQVLVPTYHVCYLGGFLTISVAVAFPYLHSKITGRTCNFGYFSNPCEIQKEIDSGG